MQWNLACDILMALATKGYAYSRLHESHFSHTLYNGPLLCGSNVPIKGLTFLWTPGIYAVSKKGESKLYCHSVLTIIGMAKMPPICTALCTSTISVFMVYCILINEVDIFTIFLQYSGTLRQITVAKHSKCRLRPTAGCSSECNGVFSSHCPSVLKSSWRQLIGCNHVAVT